MANRTLLAIYAHPDDETFGVGGTMARYSALGDRVTMVCATRGEVGEIAPGTDATPETLGEHRERELRDACAILGVTDVRFLDFRDSGMQGTPENDDPRCLHQAQPERVIEPLVRVIREVRPDVILTWDASGGYGHPDHVAVHHHATAAFHAAADASSYPRAGAAWHTPRLLYAAIPIAEFVRVFEEMRRRGIDLGFEPPGGNENFARLQRVEPNCVVDVAAEFERKQRALAAHRTQMSDDGPFSKMPDDLRRDFFSREYFYVADPPLAPGIRIDDLFAQPA
jgi:LmbE family N-acetylglucosaminyl deacetylase